MTTNLGDQETHEEQKMLAAYNASGQRTFQEALRREDDEAPQAAFDLFERSADVSGMSSRRELGHIAVAVPQVERPTNVVPFRQR